MLCNPTAVTNYEAGIMLLFWLLLHGSVVKQFSTLLSRSQFDYDEWSRGFPACRERKEIVTAIFLLSDRSLTGLLGKIISVVPYKLRWNCRRRLRSGREQAGKRINRFILGFECKAKEMRIVWALMAAEHFIVELRMGKVCEWGKQ